MRRWLTEIRGGRSQYTVADEIGIAQSTYASIESGGVFEIGGSIMCQLTVERKVRERLREWFGRGKVDRVEPVEPGVFRARMVDGGLAYAAVEENGSITIQEREVVC